MPTYRVNAKRIIDCQVIVKARSAKAALKKAESGEWEYIDDFDAEVVYAEVVPTGHVELDDDALKETR